MIMEVFHAGRYLFRPVDQSHWRYFVDTLSQEVEEGSMGTELHDDAITGGLGADTTELEFFLEIADFNQIGFNVI